MNLLSGTNVLLQSLKDTAERVAENPKATVAAATYSTGSGVLLTLQWIPTIVGTLATVAGFIATVILARYNWLKGETEAERRKNEKLKGDLLRAKAAEQGVDLDEED